MKLVPKKDPKDPLSAGEFEMNGRFSFTVKQSLNGQFQFSSI